MVNTVSQNIFNDKVYSDISRAWDNGKGGAILKVIEKLIDVAYSASLRREEESYNNISVTYIDSGSNRETYEDLRGDILFFDKEIEFNELNVGKLEPLASDIAL